MWCVNLAPLPDIECLPTQLNQVFMNLLVNSAHAMGEARGTITIRTGTEGESVWLEFSDNGSGIPVEVQSRIFDPFFTTKPSGQGNRVGPVAGLRHHSKTPGFHHIGQCAGAWDHIPHCFANHAHAKRIRLIFYCRRRR